MESITAMMQDSQFDMLIESQIKRFMIRSFQSMLHVFVNIIMTVRHSEYTEDHWNMIYSLKYICEVSPHSWCMPASS